MRRLRHPAWEQELVRFQTRRSDPGGDGVSRLFGNLKLDRPLGLLLHDNRTRSDPTALDNIMDAERNNIATAQFAVDSEIEQRKLSGSMVQL